MNIKQFTDYFRNDTDFLRNVTAWRVIPAKPAEYADFPADLNPGIVEVLQRRGFNRLYSHQATAWRKIKDGRDVVIVTPTASGKTLCYNLPVVDSIMKDPENRAIYLFPTKALSQDQVSELQEMVNDLKVDIKTHTYDGDTPSNIRQAIRKAGHIVVTNPDMLHTAILPHHTKWIKLFENLKYVVIDEIHHYRGVFGSHVANVIRRLRRICEFYGSNPQFICCSATIRNPDEMAGRIIGKEVELINNNSAPSGEKHFVFYNPPIVNWQLGIRKSSMLSARRIATELVKNGIQTILFTRTRLSCEVLTTYLREAIRQEPGQKNELIRGYRGGYLPQQRREIERGLRRGEVLGVVTTNALELGIDIGQLSACVMCGYPGTISSTWQQAGRAGRRQGVSAVFLVSSSAPLDQFIVTHPDYLFGNNVESGLINPDNLYILVNHVKCASFEIPFREGERFGNAEITGIPEFLEEQGILHKSGDRWHWASNSYPAEDISLRSTAGENFVIVDITETPRVIGEVDRFSAPMLLHEEAIYMHETRQYQVEKLDYEEKKAFVRAVDVDYYTDANLDVNIKVIQVDREQRITPDVSRYTGEIQLNALVSMFKKIKFHTHENLGAGPVNLPEQEMHTSSYWFTLSEELTGIPNPPESDDPDVIARHRILHSRAEGGLQGITNLILNMAPLYLMCDPRDIHGRPQVRSPFTEKPTIFIYDSYPGGIGLSERLYDMHDDILKASLELVSTCPCRSGCPSCVGPVDEVGKDGKKIAMEILKGLLPPI